MNKREAESLVEGVLTGPYNEADFRKLVVNIFPDLEPKSDRWTGAYIPEAFRSGVAQYGRLGKVEDAEGYTVDILAVKLKNAGTLERARTLQRNFVARYLNGGRGDALRDAALVAFYADGTPDWRFSLVRMDYALDPERNKVRKDFTPARRYSFLVGGDEKTHTAKRQLATLLQGGPVTLTELEKAFNIESVTKEFFDAYKGLFLALKDELDGLEQTDPRIRQEFAAKSIDTATFTKRLLGQIVFLYFLQKKGWLGVGRNADGSLEPWGVGPKDFLRRLFEKRVVPYENFFDDLLEPLFYEALASDRGEQSFYSRFECRIPFLNGGLFEPVGDYNWAETRINLKNETFRQIFNTFDLYNFTVREDEPLDKEVAVDPEMLGKVFENLLEVKDRKSKGAFYTPREIVHYMCQESLINYLNTALNTVTRPLLKQAPSQDDLFGRPQTRQAPLTEEVYEERVPRADIAEFIRLGDAAQEHDAATAAKVKETDAYSFKVPESIRQHAAPLDGALANIKICDPAIGSGAFPVGMMNEIVRTRGALNAYLGNAERTAYDFKRHAIQESIYGVDIEESAVDIAKLRLWLSLVVDEDDYGTIKPLPNLEYKIVIGNSLLGVEETLFNNDLFERLEKLQREYRDETRSSQKHSLKAQIDSLIADVTDNNERFDFKTYFSEVFRQYGGFDIVIANPPYISFSGRQAVSLGEITKDFLLRNYRSDGWFTAHSAFIQLAVTTLSRKITTFIVPDQVGHLSGYLPTREVLGKNSALTEVRYWGEEVFRDAVTPSLTFIACKNWKGKATLQRLDGSQISMDRIPNESWTVSEIQQLYGKMALVSRFLTNEIADPGVHTGNSSKKIILSKEDATSDSVPVLEGKQVDRYFCRKPEKVLRLQYRRAEGEYFTIRPISKYRGAEFVLRQTAPYPIVGPRQHADYFRNTLLAVYAPKDGTDVRFLVGILNSNLIRFIHQNTVHESKQKAFPQVKVAAIRQLPIRTINPSDPTDQAMHDRMVALVERMLSLHEEKGQAGERAAAEVEAEIGRADAEIDALVYRLYGLTEEEIRIVEGGA